MERHKKGGGGAEANLRKCSYAYSNSRSHAPDSSVAAVSVSPTVFMNNKRAATSIPPHLGRSVIPECRHYADGEIKT